MVVNCNWEELTGIQDVDKYWEIVESNITRVLNDLCHMKKIKIKDKGEPWKTRELIENIELIMTTFISADDITALWFSTGGLKRCAGAWPGLVWEGGSKNCKINVSDGGPTIKFPCYCRGVGNPPPPLNTPLVWSLMISQGSCVCPCNHSPCDRSQTPYLAGVRYFPSRWRFRSVSLSGRHN